MSGSSPDSSPVVVALGGNAISPADKEGNIPEQFESTRATAVSLVDLVEHGVRLLLTHGNGPQVGKVLRRVELSQHEVYPLPLYTCVADTQGGMGYMIAQCLNNELRRRGSDVIANAILTSVEVDRNDPGFQNPSKPIGGFFDPEKAQELQDLHGWQMIEARRNGKFRRVVASPKPQRIIEIKLITECINAGDLIVAAGGGGIPVARDDDGNLYGVEAVIDKDRTSALLAAEIGALTFVMATGVNKVALDFGGPNETWLDRLTVSEARRHLAEGQFPPGSMGPKIEAAIDYLSRIANPAARVIISDLDHLIDAIAGRDGTWIVPD